MREHTQAEVEREMARAILGNEPKPGAFFSHVHFEEKYAGRCGSCGSENSLCVSTHGWDPDYTIPDILYFFIHLCEDCGSQRHSVIRVLDIDDNESLRYYGHPTCPFCQSSAEP
jgi:hypothetical protein